MPLSLAPVGEQLRLVNIHGGIGIHKRLNALGLTSGVEVSIVSDDNCGGPIILAVKGSRLAIGRGLLHHIEVEAVDDKVGGRAHHSHRQIRRHRYNRGQNW